MAKIVTYHCDLCKKPVETKEDVLGGRWNADNTLERCPPEVAEFHVCWLHGEQLLTLLRSGR